MKETQTAEDLLEAFLAAQAAADSFAVADAVAYLASRLSPEADGGPERRKVERDVELLLADDPALFYRCGAARCHRRAAFFRGAKFKILPSPWEIKEGVLFYGARFAPFCTEDVFADEYVIASRGAKRKYQPLACSVRFGQVAPLFRMLGRSTMIDCIVADDPENYRMLRNSASPESAQIILTAFNFGPFYRKHRFRAGDAVIMTVADWSNGSFRAEYAPAGQRATAAEITDWVADFERGLIQAYEDHGEYLELPDQIAHAYFCAFAQGRDLRRRPFLALEEYPARMRDVAIRRDGPEWTLVPAGERDPGGGFTPGNVGGEDHSSGGSADGDAGDGGTKRPLRAEDFSASSGRLDSLDNMLEDLCAPLNYTEIYAMVQDDLANAQESATEFARKVIDLMGVKFADEAQKTAFYNYLEECWEDASERFDPVIEEAKTPLRTRLLALDLRRVERARFLADKYSTGKIPPELTRTMRDFHARILDTLGILNADCALPEGEGYEQLELRVGDIEDDWDAFDARFSK